MSGPIRKGDLAALTTVFSAAAVDASRWEGAMDAAAQVTGSVGAALLPIRGLLPTVPLSQSMHGLFAAYSRDNWHERDERRRGIPTMVRRGVMTDFDIVRPEEIGRNPYYRELLAPFKLLWFAGVKVAAGDDLWCLTLQRSPSEGPLSRGDVRRLGSLSNNLSSAAALARAMGFARAEAASDAFEMSGTAVVLFDRRGEVLRSNQAAEAVLGSSDLGIVNKRLVSWDPVATASVDYALHTLLWRKDGLSLLPPIVLPRREGCRPVLAYPSRLAGIAADCFSPCQAVVVLVDLEAKLDLTESDLKAAFNLTTAEARFARRLLGGEGIETASKKLGIAYETSRRHLKSIFNKTGTGRQAELVALLARFGARQRQKTSANHNPNGS